MNSSPYRYVRFAVGAALLATGALAMAGGVIQPSKQEVHRQWVRMNTSTFIPQIRNDMQYPPKRPNSEYSPAVADGPRNSLRAGSANGATQATTLARFPGMDFNGYFPPDCDLAVSKTHVVEVVNSSIAWYTKSGSKQFQQVFGPGGFFSAVSPTPFVFDPKCFYDPKTNRFFVIVLEQDDTQKISKLLVGVSDDGDPNGNWNLFRIEAKDTKDSTDYWLDYPGWGFSSEGVVCTGNMFAFGNNAYGYVQSIVMNKNGLTDPGNNTLTLTRFQDTSVFTIQPCDVVGSNRGQVLGVSTLNQSNIRLFAYQDILTATPTVVFTDVSVPTIEATFGGAETPAGFQDALLYRMMEAVSRNNSVVAAHTINVTGSTVPQVRWYEINAGSWPSSGTPTLKQSGNIAFANGDNAYLPSINMNSVGDISVVFTRSSRSIAADMMIASRKATDPLGSMGSPKPLAVSAGLNPFGRWGDYFGCKVDPSDDLTFWGVAELNKANDVWTTEIQKWTVSTGGGGGANTIAPTSITSLEGTFVSGNLNSVKDTDGLVYRQRAVKRPAGGYFTALQLDYSITEARTNVGSIELNVTGGINPGRRATITVYLWDWNASQWVAVRSQNVIAPTMKSFAASVTANVSRFVSTTKKVRALVRTYDPVRRGGAAPTLFVDRLDSARIGITTIN